MLQLRMIKYSDLPLWVCVGVLIVISFFLIYGATFTMLQKADFDTLYFVKKHLVSLIIGIIGLLLFLYLDYKYLKSVSFPFYLFMIFVLIGVIFIGYESQGAQRWLSIGPFSFQPSEFGKMSLILILAKYFENTKSSLESFSDLIIPSIIAGIPFLLIFKQPDLGTALVSLAIFFGMLLWAKANTTLILFLFTPLISMIFSLAIFWWIIYVVALFVTLYIIRMKLFDFIIIFASNLALGLGTPFVWATLQDYQKTRILSFLNPGIDPLGAGYHSLQSQIAVGSGGFFGRGFLHGTQTALQFIPKQWMDFIFSVVGEEFGFVGSVFILIVFLVIIWRGIIIAMTARDYFGTLIAGGIISMYTFHVMVNIGMTLGIMPVVGIPLPFLSFGGSALLINLICIGILQSIAMRRHKIFF